MNSDTRPRIARAEPQLFTTDIVASAAFFRDKLGFRTVFLYGEPPFYGQVARDGVALNLRQVDTPVIEPGLRDREQLLAVTMSVASAADIAALFQEYEAASVRFAQRLDTKTWGAQDFIVTAPDGNLLLFAGPAA